MVRVAGIYEPTPDPMRFTAQRLEAHMHLPDLVALVADSADPAARELASAINVKLIDPHDAGAFASELAARAPGAIVRPTSRTRDDDPFAVLDRFHVAISAVTVLGATAFLLALMVIRAEERAIRLPSCAHRHLAPLAPDGGGDRRPAHRRDGRRLRRDRRRRDRKPRQPCFSGTV